MYTAELFTGGLPPAELAKRSEQVQKAKKGPICKGSGCLTRISGYNRDYKGNPETRCYKCRSEMVSSYEMPRPSAAKQAQLEKARASREPLLFCKKRGHDMSVVGRYASGACRECERIDSLERARIKRVLEGRPAEAAKTYKLKNLKALKLEWGGTYEVLVRETGIKEHSLKKWVPGNVGTFMWNIEALAEFFTKELGRPISVEDLISREGEVAQM